MFRWLTNANLGTFGLCLALRLVKLPCTLLVPGQHIGTWFIDAVDAQPKVDCFTLAQLKRHHVGLIQLYLMPLQVHRFGPP